MPKKGFTILELLVTIFFISVGMTAVLIAIQQPMAHLEAFFLRLTAIYLAQEGIEIVRNIRDGNWLAGVAWDTNLGAGRWEADHRTERLTDPYHPPGRFLLIDGGFYNYSPGTSTLFRREIIIEREGLPPDQMKVTVIVHWEARGQHQVSVEEILYNWGG